jgi:hypothetical protein
MNLTQQYIASSEPRKIQRAIRRLAAFVTHLPLPVPTKPDGSKIEFRNCTHGFRQVNPRIRVVE